MDSNITRRSVLGGMTGLATLQATGGALAQALKAPSGPVAINIMDVAGNLQLTQVALERFRDANPKLVSRLTFSRAPSPELPGKLKAMQDAGRVDIDLVMTGPGALSDGIAQGLWIDVLTKYASSLPKPEEIYHPTALMLQKNFGKDQGVQVAFTPSGPLFEYMPAKVKQVPKTAADLLAWVKANPNRFTYARPANSGPGWTFLMGMPYILGDTDPTDPDKGWAKTWAFLKELDNGIDYYPTGTGATMKELGEGTRDMIVTTLGWDINPRALGVVPKEAETFALENTHWVPDAQFMCVPKLVSDDKLYVILQLMSFLLKPEQQALTWDKGYLYPGPSVKDVPLSMAPAESQAIIKEFGRDQYPKMIADFPARAPLTPDRLIMAFRKWDQEIGARKTK